VSSSVVGAFDVKTVPSWPHYVAAKAALEALFRVAAVEYRNVQFTIVRPPKLLTALHNTPTGRVDALDPQRVAERIVEYILTAPRSGAVEVLDDFN
jgi:NAD(P)-dependent dehydrogenase (short-subunit alcohol dehydrogenase family)